MATRPKTDVDADTGATAEVRVDEGLAKLYETWQRREATNNQQLVSIIRYVVEHKLSSKVVKATLMTRGLTDASVSSEVSRIMSLAKPENAAVLQALEDGEITVAAARKAIAKPQQRPSMSPADKVWGMVYRAAVAAYKFSRDDPTFNLKYFVQEATNAWGKAEEDYEAKEAEAEAEAEGKEPAEELESAEA